MLNLWDFRAAIFDHLTSLMKNSMHFLWLQSEMFSNLFSNIGEKFTKDVIMWSPDQALNLYLDGDKSKVVDLSNQALLDEKFPKFNNASKHIGRLQPGKDILRNGQYTSPNLIFESYH